MRSAIITALFFASFAFFDTASAQDWKIRVDFTAEGKRTSGYWLVQGTQTPEVFVSQRFCEERAQAILALLQSLRAQIHTVRCTR
jgi:hypothetical protein